MMCAYLVGHEQMLEHLNVWFIYVIFVSRFFASKHSLIVFMPDLCANFIQKVPKSIVVGTYLML